MANLKNFIPAIRFGHTLGIGSLEGAGLFTFGNIWYVKSTTGSDTANDGKSVETPFATVSAANSAATANNGDKVIILQGHAETVTSSSLTLSKAGVEYICMGEGQDMPVFTFSAAAATITVSGASIRWNGGSFIANFADVAAAFTLGAAKDFILDGGRFTETSANLNWFNIVVTGATDNAADGLTVKNCNVLMLDALGKAFVSVLGNLNRLDLEDNFVDTASTADAAQFLTMSSKVCLGARILRNTLIALGASGTTVGIFATGSSTTSTGVMAFNLATSLDTTTELFDTATLDFAHFENYYTGVIAKSGYLVPVADSAA